MRPRQDKRDVFIDSASYVKMLSDQPTYGSVLSTRLLNCVVLVLWYIGESRYQ